MYFFGLDQARRLILLAVVCLASVLSPVRAAEPFPNFEEARNRLITEDVAGAGVKNPRVLDSMRKTPRHEFVPEPERKNSYFDMGLPIGNGQTISAPFIVAFMTEQVDPQPTDKVLEIGTGSGYQAAVLSPLVDTVYTIEIVEPLGKRAAQTLKRLKYKNVVAKVGDGFKGWPEHAPFDKIIVTCSPENVPQPLVDQLKEGGRMVVPLGQRYQQTLYLFRKEKGKLISEALRPTLFVPMTGKAEDDRAVKPDPLNPAILNGSFEETDENASEPPGWHYLRQAEVVADPVKDGKRAIALSNAQMGRGAQGLQAFAVDGRHVTQLDLSAWVKAKNIELQSANVQMPLVAITFYDERRAPVGVRGLGPWSGTFDWRKESERIKVPPKAREAILAVGLLGATGQLWIDDVQLTPVAAK